MLERQPSAISAAARGARLRRAARIARGLGFVGRVEYRHVYSGAGGAQYGVGPAASRDLLIVYAEAFERDVDPDDFSLAAILAHERGHQLLSRHPPLRQLVAGKMTLATEEILASLLGSLVAEAAADREALALKALSDAVHTGLPLTDAVRLVAELRQMLESAL